MTRSSLLPHILLWLACLAALALSLRLGSAGIGFDALLSGQDGLLAGRAVRSLCAMAVGAALAAAGVMLQGLTGNPLADPGITGVNAGAALAAVAWAYFVPGTGGSGILLAAVAGAGGAGLALWGLAGGTAALGRDTIALRLPLAGLAIEAFCLSAAAMLILTDAGMQARYLRWISGAIPPVLRNETGPLAAIGLALAGGFLACGRLALLGLGAEQSHSLGRDPRLTVALVLGLVVVLSGAAVAIAGPIAFLGLIAPFAARGLAGPSLSRAYLCALPLGAAGLTLADTAGRVIARPGEIDAGIVVALLGGPGLILVLRSLLRRAGTA